MTRKKRNTATSLGQAATHLILRGRCLPLFLLHTHTFVCCCCCCRCRRRFCRCSDWPPFSSRAEYARTWRPSASKPCGLPNWCVVSALGGGGGVQTLGCRAGDIVVLAVALVPGAETVVVVKLMMMVVVVMLLAAVGACRVDCSACLLLLLACPLLCAALYANSYWCCGGQSVLLW